MRTSIGARANLELIEENYRRWQRNPESVDSGWSAFFEGFELGNLPQRDGAAATEARAATVAAAVPEIGKLKNVTHSKAQGANQLPGHFLRPRRRVRNVAPSPTANPDGSGTGITPAPAAMLVPLWCR